MIKLYSLEVQHAPRGPWIPMQVVFGALPDVKALRQLQASAERNGLRCRTVEHTAELGARRVVRERRKP